MFCVFTFDKFTSVGWLFFFINFYFYRVLRISLSFTFTRIFILLILILFHSLHSNLPKVVLHGPHVHTCGIHHKTQKSIAVVVSIFLYMLLAHTWFFNASVLASTLALLGTGRPPITTWLYLLLKSFFSVNDLKAK